MPRARTLHPTFFTNHELYHLESTSGLPLRLAFEGLWCVADREGRFEWNPARLKLDILPFDVVDFSAVLEALLGAQFVVRYEVGRGVFGWIPTFSRWQKPHPHEAKSRIEPYPGPDKGRQCRGKVRQCNDKVRQCKQMSAGLSSLRTLKPSDISSLGTPAARFEEAWALYPKRPNNSKAKARKVYLARLEEGADPETILAGLKNYAAYVVREQIPPKYVKHASTFFGPDKHWESDFGDASDDQLPVYDDNGEMTLEAARALGIVV